MRSHGAAVLSGSGRQRPNTVSIKRLWIYVLINLLHAAATYLTLYIVSQGPQSHMSCYFTKTQLNKDLAKFTMCYLPITALLLYQEEIP